MGEEETEAEIMELERKCDINNSELNSLFAKIDDRRRVSIVLHIIL